MGESWNVVTGGIVLVVSLLVFWPFARRSDFGPRRRLFYILANGDNDMAELDVFDQVQFIPRDIDVPSNVELGSVVGEGTIIVHRRSVSASGLEDRHASEPPIVVRRAELIRI